MPNPSMFTWYEQLRTETQLSLDYFCGLQLPHPHPSIPVLFLFPLIFLLLRSTRNELCTPPRSQWCHPWEHSASAVRSCAVVLILCLSASPPPSLPPPSSLLTFSYKHPRFRSTLALSLFSFSLIHHPPPPSLSVALFLSIRCPNDFTGDRCQTYVMASFYRMSISSSVSVSDCPRVMRACWV